MQTDELVVGDRRVLDTTGLEVLVSALLDRSFRVLGPVVRDGAVRLIDIGAVSDLPAGWADEQEAGRYRLHRRDDGRLFGHANGPQSWKQFLLPPRQLLWRATGDSSDIRLEGGTDGAGEGRLGARPLAFFGVRPCDLRAIAVLDRIYRDSAHPDPGYVARRRSLFLVALNCTEPGGTCFCTSMGTGPRADGEFDLAVTEVAPGQLVVTVGSAAGASLLASVPSRPATAEDVAGAERQVDEAAARMGRELPDAASLPALLRRTLEHPRWDQVAERCLSCANCTMVCPTCFCSTVDDVTDVTGEHAERWRRWDSCFTADHSYLHGGSVRSSTRSRYRQWLTHKFGTWWDQFGTSGCVGCGRCITWCPVAIDVTEELQALREEP